MSVTEQKPHLLPTSKRSYFIFCIFIIIAAGLWLMIKLMSAHSATLQFTAQISNSATGGVFTTDKNGSLYIQAKARGFYILHHRLTKNHILNIDLKDNKLLLDKTAKTSGVVKLPMLSIKDKIADLLGSDVEIISIDPDTLYLNYSKPYSKKVPVVGKFTLSFQKEYMLTSLPLFEPDSVLITGPREILDTLQAVYTQPTVYSNLKEKVDDDLSIEPVNNTLLSQRKVKVILNVERCTESVIKLPVKIINASAASSILLLPPQVDVKYITRLQDYRHIHTENFYAVVDYNDADSIMGRKLKVKLLHKPKQVISVTILPEFVEFIQQKSSR